MTVIRSHDGHAELRTISRKPLSTSVQQRASIDPGEGSPHRNCVVCDLSQKGAQIALAGQNDIPDEFRLMLGGGGAFRRCRIAWRTEQQVAVEFCIELAERLNHIGGDIHATIMGKRASSTPASSSAPAEPAPSARTKSFANAVYPKRVRHCLAKHRSYDPATRSYIGHDGNIRRCL
jgi:hypothetical protein